MGAVDIIRAWKDDEYRLDLSAEQRRLLPEHPAGEVDLDGIDEEVGYIYTTPASAPDDCPTRYW